jgi:hypothetical protein
VYDCLRVRVQQSYSSFIVRYAKLASSLHVDVFSVGLELVDTTPQTQLWRSLIASVRQEFSGPIVYGVLRPCVVSRRVHRSVASPAVPVVCCRVASTVVSRVLSCRGHVNSLRCEPRQREQHRVVGRCRHHRHRRVLPAGPVEPVARAC